MDRITLPAERLPGNVRDPMILNVEGKYYLTATMPPFWGKSNAGVFLWSSDNLADWVEEGLIIDRESIPQDAWAKERFWAPEIFEYKGRFILAFSCNHPGTQDSFGVFLAFSDSVKGPYVMQDPDWPLIAGGIDASFFEDHDKVYVSYAQGDVMISEVDTTEWKLEGIPVRAIERGEEGTWDHDGVEGNFIVKKNGRYFMWYSSWTRGYDIGLASSDTLLGTWTKHAFNPVISKENGETSNILCGHACVFVMNDGREGLAYHVHAYGEKEVLHMDIGDIDYENITPWVSQE